VLRNTEDGWKPPDLEETLRVCESNIRLNDVPVGLNMDTLADQVRCAIASCGHCSSPKLQENKIVFACADTILERNRPQTERGGPDPPMNLWSENCIRVRGYNFHIKLRRNQAREWRVASRRGIQTHTDIHTHTHYTHTYTYTCTTCRKQASLHPHPFAAAPMLIELIGSMHQAKRSSMDDVDWAVGGNFSMAAQKTLQSELRQRTYWRESLENILDSLLFTTGVLMLVVIDVCQLLLYQFLLPQNADGSEPIPQRVLTVTVLGLFWVELTMRQIAKGGRFYREGWNLFDLFVIYGSCVVMVTRYSLEGFGAKDVNVDDFQNINLLRIISRVAIGMRVRCLHTARTHSQTYTAYYIYIYVCVYIFSVCILKNIFNL
jgi:hypothetical protein